MNRLNLLAVGVLSLAAVQLKAAPVADTFECQLRYYGSADEESPIPGPVSRAALFSGDSQLGAIRYDANQPDGPVRDGVTYTEGDTLMALELGDAKLESNLYVAYAHATKLGADGKPEKAVQKTCIMANLTHNHMYVVGTLSKGCGIQIIPGGPVVWPNGIATVKTKADEDPFDPANGWTPVKIIDGVPQLDLNETQFVETPSGAGVLKIACSNSLDPSGPIHKHQP